MSTLSLINTFNPFAHFKKEVSEIYQRICNRSVFIPLYGYKKQSLNLDVIEASLSTDQYLVQNPLNTYFIKVKGDAMAQAGIFDNDILVVDRSIQPKTGQTVLAEVNGQYLVRTLGENSLISANPKYPAIPFSQIEKLAIIGIVTGSMRKFG